MSWFWSATDPLKMKRKVLFKRGLFSTGSMRTKDTATIETKKEKYAYGLSLERTH